MKKVKLEKGVKYDGDKPRWDLLPWEEIDEIVKVLTFGSEKYEDDNCKKVPDASRRYLAAAMRHIKADASGEFNDPETGLPHLAHAGCCLLFKSWIDKKNQNKVEANGFKKLDFDPQTFKSELEEV